jgi:ATP-dependent RNA helicase DHX36
VNAGHAAPTSKSGKQTQPQSSAHKPSNWKHSKRVIWNQQAKKGAQGRRSQPGDADTTSHSPPLTEGYIKKNLSLPTRKQYPNAPNKLFEFLERDSKAFNFGVFERLFRNKLNFKSPKSSASPHGGHLARHSLVAVAFNEEKIAVFGDGSTRKQALRGCCIHLVARLHESGLLNEFFGKPTIAFMKGDPPGLDVKITVFEHAARFMLVPRYTTTPISDDTLHKARAQGNVRAKHQCTIELSEHGLTAIGVGMTHSQAEAAASIRFLDLAQERITDTPTLHCVVSSVMADFRNFWDHRKGVLTVSMTEESGKDRKLHRAQSTLAGQPIGEAVIMSRKSDAEQVAMLTAAVALGKENPDLLLDFEKALQAGGGKIMRAVRPIQVDLSNNALETMAKASKFLYQQGALKPITHTTIESIPEAPIRSRKVRNFTNHNRRNETLQKALADYQDSPTTEGMRSKREELPINRHRTEILKSVSENPYTVVVGATGSGKTTQVPQMFLEAASEVGKGALCNVIVTQPRRIAATSVARRVADERGEQLRDSVGYIVRHNSAPPREDGSILFCTTGVLLQQLQTDPDQVFDTSSHILLDEVHERDILLDFLLVVLKKALKERQSANKSVPKVVLMSATMNTELFSNYFGVTDADGRVVPCPSIDVPGRLFPVKNRYLREIHSELQSQYGTAKLRGFFNEKDTSRYLSNELQPIEPSSGITEADTGLVPGQDDYDPDDSLTPVGLIAATVAHVANTTDEGAILVFLPGQNEIQATNNLLTRKPVFGVDFKDQSRYKLFVLHSTTSAQEQAAVFDPVPEGCRKIILSTNIAETSVTIPDVQHIVDSGKHREKRYDSTNRISALKSAWVSKANAKQRAGRAGRVQNGNYYGLYTEERLNTLQTTGKAEMLRADLQEICLDVKAHGFRDSIGDFLSQALEPPSPTSVRSAVSTLQSIEALTEDEDLTPLGELLATLPVQPAMGKMIVLGIIFRCLDPILILSALSGSRNLLVKPSGKRPEWERSHQELLGQSQSEHIAQISAFKAMRQCVEERGPGAAYEFASRQFISMAAYDQTRRAAQDIEQILVQSQLIPYTSPNQRFRHQFGDEELNVNSRNVPLIKALALVGFAPNLAINTGGRWFRTSSSDEVAVHPKSLFAPKSETLDYGGAMMTYSTLFSSDDSSLSMRDITEVSHATAMLFGGKLNAKRDGSRKLLVLDDWLPFSVGSWTEDASLVHRFRQGLDTVSSKANPLSLGDTY